MSYIQQYVTATASKYTAEHHWAVKYSKRLGSWPHYYDSNIFVGFETYRSHMVDEGFDLVYSHAEGDRRVELWIMKETT